MYLKEKQEQTFFVRAPFFIGPLPAVSVFIFQAVSGFFAIYLHLSAPFWIRKVSQDPIRPPGDL